MKKRKQQQMLSRWIKCALVLVAVWACVGIPSMKSYADELEKILYEGPVFAENEENVYPEEILEQNGKQYRRLSVEERSAEKAGTLTYVSAVVPCQLEGKEILPKQASITLFFEVTGEEYQREVSLLEIREKNTYWINEFSFPVTVCGYGAEVFYLGEYEIPAQEDLMKYSDSFLAFLDLPMDCYQIERVEWAGEPYEKDGILYRDATAYGQKLIRDVEAVYGGQVRTPNIPAKQYVAVYEEIVETASYDESGTVDRMEVEKKPEAASGEFETVQEVQTEGSLTENAIRWIKDHITVVIFSSLFFVCLGIGLLLLCGAKKHNAENEEENKI